MSRPVFPDDQDRWMQEREDQERRLRTGTGDIIHVVGAALEPAFQNGWVVYAVGWAVPAFWRDATGVVRLRGIAKSGVVGQKIFDLPPAYRPGEREMFAVDSASGHGRVDVDSGGGVWVVAGINTHVSLSGIEFLAEK